jgi:molecular chaperone DnaJ
MIKKQRINSKKFAEAYEVLSNSEKKQRYDQFGHQQQRPSGGNGRYYDMDEILRNFTKIKIDE